MVKKWVYFATHLVPNFAVYFAHCNSGKSNQIRRVAGASHHQSSEVPNIKEIKM